MNKRRRNLDKSSEKAGWRVAEYAEALSCSKSSVNNMLAAKLVESRKLGTMRIITTPPSEAIAALDGVSLAALASEARAAQPKPAGRPRGRPRLLAREALAAAQE
jgi:hypothetical protein